MRTSTRRARTPKQEAPAIDVAAFERTLRDTGADDKAVIARLYEEAKRWGDNRVMAQAFRQRARTIWLTLPMPMDRWGWEPERNIP